jgi:hypothetical protein
MTDLTTQLNNRLEVLETELQEMQKAFEVTKSTTTDLINGTINWQHLYKTLEAVVEETMVAYPNADAIQLLKEKFMQRVEPLLSRMSGQDETR